MKATLRYIAMACVMVSAVQTSYSQATLPNDECRFATFIPDVDGYCSTPGEFTNVGATPDPVATDLCFLDYSNGVWFSFVPREPAIDIAVFGLGTGGTMGSPQLALFSSCGDYVNCSPSNVSNVSELIVSGLLIGQVYYIMVESAPGGEGTFQLCVNDFIAPPSPQSDCDEAVILCDKSPFVVANLDNVGDNPNEGRGSCIGGERASSWYKWVCDQPGTLTMELIPANLGIVEQVDDLDFVIYELPDGLDNCNTAVTVRCMGSGANIDENDNVLPVSTWPLCNRATGMRDGETDLNETGGCQGNSNNYIRPLEMRAGSAYAMLINNFSTSGLGFEIEFGGTGTFLGPDIDVGVEAVQAFECDKTIIFTQSSSSPDSIISYTWNFGAGSTPSFGNTPDDVDVIYESFGPKTAALTIETDRGCTVTEIVDFDVAACCADTSTLDIDAESFDVVCFGDLTGLVQSRGISGSPEYQFSLDGVNFQPNPQFAGLGAGTYEVQVIDIKGCMATIVVTIEQPEEIVVTPSPDITIDLGDDTIFDFSVTPPNPNYTIEWSNPETLEDCVDCLTPTVTPRENGSYSVTVTDENGCTAVAEVRVNVVFNPEITAPNVFSPNSDDNPDNEWFNLFGDVDVEVIEDLFVYDRWGNLVYQGRDLERSGRGIGWNGDYLGRPAEQGVYAWMGRVRFINGEVVNFTGDLTLIR